MSINLRRSVLGTLSVCALAVGATVLPSGAAQAASYNGVCGSSYGVIDHANISGGTVYLTYSGSTGKNCVVTIRNTPGARMYMAARVSLAGDPWISDADYYTTYAGPVYVSAPGRCIDWGGTIGDSTFVELGTHCG